MIELTNPIARRTDPESSHESARAVTYSGQRQTHADIMLDAVMHKPGLTSAELAEYAGLERHEAARRLADLEHAKRVVKGENTVPCRVSGRRCVAWYAR